MHELSEQEKKEVDRGEAKHKTVHVVQVSVVDERVFFFFLTFQ